MAQIASVLYLMTKFLVTMFVSLEQNLFFARCSAIVMFLYRPPNRSRHAKYIYDCSTYRFVQCKHHRRVAYCHDYISDYAQNTMPWVEMMSARTALWLICVNCLCNGLSILNSIFASCNNFFE